jgi:hypothetical protein
VVDILLLQTVSIVVASAGVFAAAIYYIFQIRLQTKMRKTELITRFSSTLNFTASEVWAYWNTIMSCEFTSLDDYEKKYGSVLDRSNPRNQAFQAMLWYYDSVGLLLKEKLIDIKLVEAILGVKAAWNKMKPLIIGIREKHGLTHVFENFEYLYNEVKKREQQLASKKA